MVFLSVFDTLPPSGVYFIFGELGLVCFINSWPLNRFDWIIHPFLLWCKTSASHILHLKLRVGVCLGWLCPFDLPACAYVSARLFYYLGFGEHPRVLLAHNAPLDFLQVYFSRQTLIEFVKFNRSCFPHLLTDVIFLVSQPTDKLKQAEKDGMGWGGGCLLEAPKRRL